jgi:hypothetical protein
MSFSSPHEILYPKHVNVFTRSNEVLNAVILVRRVACFVEVASFVQFRNDNTNINDKLIPAPRVMAGSHISRLYSQQL